MDDLISRQAAIKALEDAGMVNYLATGEFHGIINALNVIKGLPTAELVRCKDCKHYNEEERLCNDLMGFGRYWEEDDFCSCAERRTDG